MKFTFFSIEYADVRHKSICRIGLLSREADAPRETAVSRCFLVNPRSRFDPNCVRVHGISEETVCNAPTLEALWPKIKDYFEDAVVVGHNVVAGGLESICSHLSRRGKTPSPIHYICTYRMARELIPSFAVEDYSLTTLCNFFNISGEAYEGPLQKAYVCSELLDRLLSFPLISPESSVERYEYCDKADLEQYVSSAAVKSAIHAFYGMIQGIALDHVVSGAEKERVKGWREIFRPYESVQDVAGIVSVVDAVLADNAITPEEIETLRQCVRRYLDVVSVSPATLAAQILQGIIKGMITDDSVTEAECRALRNWLYENNYLVNHPPFDALYRMVEDVLADGVLTQEEALCIRREVETILGPIESLHKELSSVNGKRVCLSGDFAYGGRAEIEARIRAEGGILHETVQSTTDVLLVGEASFSPTQYSDEIKAALALNNAGGQIRISRERELVDEPRTFSELLFSYIDDKGLSDAEVYKRAHLPRQTMSKIKCVSDYMPSKQSICAFAVALELTLEQTNLLLAAAGYVLSPNLAFDQVIMDAIRQKKYDVFAINGKLCEMGIRWVDTK